MGSVRPFVPEKLVVPLLIANPALLSDVVVALEASFGLIDYRSREIPFEFTSYYEAEMGAGLSRVFLAFDDLVSPERLARIKLESNRIEQRYAVKGKRVVNIDPGLLSLSRLTLASTKDNGRRIPLSDGIYAEITLVYHDGDFHSLDWTYPDFRSREYRDTLCDIRRAYRDQLKRHEGQRSNFRL